MTKKQEAKAQTISVERHGIEINPDEVTNVQDFGNVVHVTVGASEDGGNEATYQLTRDEAAPLLENEGKAGIAQEV